MAHRPRTLFVGFGHKARQGKDWVCQRIHEELPHATKVYALAGPMYLLGDALFGMRVKDGKFLQALGTEVGRRARPSYWIDLLENQVRRDDPPIALIPDVRFLNEAQYIQDNGGICIKVERLDSDGNQYIDPERPASHTSETELDSYLWNWRIVAKSGDLLTLERQAVDLAKRLQDWLDGWKDTNIMVPEHKNFPRAYSVRKAEKER